MVRGHDEATNTAIEQVKHFEGLLNAHNMPSWSLYETKNLRSINFSLATELMTPFCEENADSIHFIKEGIDFFS